MEKQSSLDDSSSPLTPAPTPILPTLDMMNGNKKISPVNTKQSPQNVFPTVDRNMNHISSPPPRMDDHLYAILADEEAVFDPYFPDSLGFPASRLPEDEAGTANPRSLGRIMFEAARRKSGRSASSPSIGGGPGGVKLPIEVLVERGRISEHLRTYREEPDSERKSRAKSFLQRYSHTHRTAARLRPTQAFGEKNTLRDLEVASHISEISEIAGSVPSPVITE